MLCHCWYFAQPFTEMFLELFSTNHWDRVYTNSTTTFSEIMELFRFLYSKRFFGRPLSFLNECGLNYWILLVTITTTMTTFGGKESKFSSAEAIKGMKLVLSIHVHDMNRFLMCFHLLLPLWLHYFGNFLNGKSGSWYFCLCYCGYFDISKCSWVVFYQLYKLLNYWFDWSQ